MTYNTIKTYSSKCARYMASYLPVWKKKEIGFYSNFGHGDIGDDAQFYAAQEALGRPLVPLSKKCYAFNPHRLRALLIGGGGALRWESPYIPRRILLKSTWDFPVILFGPGVNCDFGKKYSQETIDKICALSRVCTYKTVRDTMTKRLLESWGCTDIHVLPDLDMALSSGTAQEVREKDHFTIGIVLTPHSEFSDACIERIIRTFTEYIMFLVSDKKRVILYAFEDAGAGDTREAHMIQRIVEAVKSPLLTVYSTKEPQQLLLEIKRECDMMICMRMHSAAFAVNAGIPFGLISYNMMHKGLIEMMGLEECEVELDGGFSYDALVHVTAYIIDHKSALAKHITERCTALREMIRTHCTAIQQIIEGKKG